MFLNLKANISSKILFLKGNEDLKSWITLKVEENYFYSENFQG